jgi:preprotein translocase subunit YajC
MTLFARLFSQISNSYADGAAPAAGNPMMQFLPLVVVFVIFYFLMIRPQKKKFDQEQEMLSKIQKGDEIYSKSGIIGTISGLSDKVVTLETTEGVKIKILRNQIGGLLKTVLESK